MKNAVDLWTPATKPFACHERSSGYEVDAAQGQEEREKYYDRESKPLEPLRPGEAIQGTRTGHCDAVFEPPANVSTMWR